MHLGLVGLGKMGGNMRHRLRDAGHTVVGYDRDPELADVGSLEELVAALPSPKVVWVMVPAGGPTHETVDRLGELLGEGDLVVDGGNSRWTDDQAHAAALAEKGIGFVDCGVSGGVWGRENGYALMYGGSAEDVGKRPPAFDALKPPGEFGSVLNWFGMMLLLTLGFTTLLTAAAFGFHDLLGNVLPPRFHNSIEFNTIYGRALSVMVFFALWAIAQTIFSRQFLARQGE